MNSNGNFSGRESTYSRESTWNSASIQSGASARWGVGRVGFRSSGNPIVSERPCWDAVLFPFGWECISWLISRKWGQVVGLVFLLSVTLESLADFLLGEEKLWPWCLTLIRGQECYVLLVKSFWGMVSALIYTALDPTGWSCASSTDRPWSQTLNRGRKN
jgi:hypothetical protein